MTKKRTKLEWQQDERCQELVGKLADEMAEHLELVAPIDPFEVIRREHPLLVAGGRDFGDRYDGKLKYNKEKKRFLLFYNTKYDRWQEPGTNHPRTRFSICHELGHYFIDAHHKYLLRGGKPHPSSGEFKTAAQMEREADAFASSLLLPTHLVEPVLNNGELTVKKLDKVATDFGASLLSTTIRGVRLSDLPCAVAGIRDGSQRDVMAQSRDGAMRTGQSAQRFVGLRGAATRAVRATDQGHLGTDAQHCPLCREQAR